MLDAPHRYDKYKKNGKYYPLPLVKCAETRGQALKRDGNRCALSGAWDYSFYFRQSKEEKGRLAKIRASTVPTSAAHIIPQKMAKDLNNAKKVN